ncbi:MAG: hypothetical protein GY751_07920 [Bacteroidetes bacterium]|nr:hypothetical protein [Bacteroidota bacterium]
MNTLLIMSHTIDPERDSSQKLYAYSKAWFITGGDEQYANCEKQVLIDKVGRICGYCNDTDSLDI